MTTNDNIANGPDWADVAVGYQRVMRVFESFVRPVLADHGVERIGIGNALFLYIIGDGKRRVAELVREQGYAGSNASYSMMQLEAVGLIERSVDPGDKRVRFVCLTDTGSALLSAMREACKGDRSDIDGALKGISAFQATLSRDALSAT